MNPFFDFKKDFSEMINSVVPKFCEKCGNKFLGTEFELIKSENENIVSKITCSKCKYTFVMHFVTDEMGRVGVAKSPLKSSLSANEIKKFMSLGPITEEEMLDSASQILSFKSIKDFRSFFDKLED